MTGILRAARAFGLAGLLTLSLAVPAPPALAQRVAETAAVPAPRYLQPKGEVPWLYRGSDVPVDGEWLFGEMPNGLRYAVRRNGVPPRQVSIRVRIDAGSLHEEDSEQGYAHLLEHLLFRESKYLAPGTAIAAWQRLGATFGSDANAETTPTHTAYKLDIPNIDRAKLTESFRLLSGMVRAPVLSDANVRAELPIVLAEKRERGGAGQRVADLTRRTFFAGQRLAARSPIGTEDTLRAATGRSVRAFYERWYRPENTVIAVAGDADPLELAGLVEQWFGDWKGRGKRVPAPDFGDPVAPPGALDEPVVDAPLGDMAVALEPDLPRSLTYAILRPWREKNDTIAYNQGLLLDAVAQSIINRRLESRARAGGSFLYAQLRQENISRSVDGTFITFAPLSGDWQAALDDVRGVIADALAEAPTEDEIDREVAEFDVVFANQLEQEAVQSAGDLVNNLVNAVDIRETIAAPGTVLDVFRSMRARFTPEEVLAHTRRLFRGDVLRAAYVTPVAGEADEASLRLALAREVKVDSSARLAAQDIRFEDLPQIGEPGEITARRAIGVLEVEQIEFANGVRALVWANDAEPGRVTVRVRFGAGQRAFDAQSAVYATLGETALVGSGIGELGQNEIDRLLTGRKVRLDLGIEEGVFTLTGQTRPDDLAVQLYLAAAKLAMPRWDRDPVLRAKAAGELAYNTFSTSPGGVLRRDMEFIATGRDPRFATPSPEDLRGVTPEGFRAVWEPLLAEGPLEVLVFGDFDQSKVAEQLRVTFGALPQRTAIAPEVAARLPGFASPAAAPQVLHHRGDANQAAAAVIWPSGGGMEKIRESRRLEILTQLFNNRLLDALRERAGASYSPQVYSQWPNDVPAGGRITALAQLEPDFVPIFFAEADRIARDLATTGPTADELDRVTGPLGEAIRRATTGYQFWLFNLEGAAFDPQRIAQLRSLMVDYTQTTPEAMKALAAQYLAPEAALRLAVIPQGQELAAPPAATDGVRGRRRGK